MKKFAAVLCLGLTGLMGRSLADSVLIENFEKASESESVAAVDGATVWTSRGNRPVLGVAKDDDGLKSGLALRLSKGLVYVTFSEVTLEDGDSLELSFRYRFAEPPPQTGFPLRVGLFKDDTGDPSSGNAPGYWFMAAAGVENGNAMLILEEGSDGALGGGKDIPILPPMFHVPASGTAANRVSLTVTRVSADSIDVTGQINEESSITRTDTTGKISQFNAFAISLAVDDETNFLVDDVALTVKRKAN